MKRFTTIYVLLLAFESFIQIIMLFSKTSIAKVINTIICLPISLIDKTYPFYAEGSTYFGIFLFASNLVMHAAFLLFILKFIKKNIKMPFTLAISEHKTHLKTNNWLKFFIGFFLICWINSFIGNTDAANWFLENTLVFLFLGFLIFTYKKFIFSDLSYLLICIYLCLHVYGSKYTYAENPFGYWLKDAMNLSRNQYDRIVHFSFGFLLAYPMRELFLRWLKFPTWVAWTLPLEITLSVSGFYELIEWAVADIFFKAQGDAYLGSQGDIWDAQKDMFLALIGAIMATSLVSVIKKLASY